MEAPPFLDRLKKRDLEVLFLVDLIDEYVLQQLMFVTKEGLVKFASTSSRRAVFVSVFEMALLYSHAYHLVIYTLHTMAYTAG